MSQRTPEQESVYQNYLAARREYVRIENLRNAAPDLLDALKLLHAHIFGPTGAAQRQEIDEKCRAAIEKAEGRS